MKIIDSHHHLWNFQALDYIWLKQIGKPKPFGEPTPIQNNYITKDFIFSVCIFNYSLPKIESTMSG